VATIQTTEENLIPALRLAADMLREPSFPDSEFDQVRTQRIAGIENSRTDPAALARLAMDRNLNVYPRNDVRHVGTIDEDIEDLKKVTLDDLKQFHAKFYGAAHGDLIVVGQFDPASVRKEAADLLGNWTSPAPYAKISENFQKSAPANLKIETPDKENSTFEAGFNLSMKDTDPDYPAMVLANYMLGGSLNSRLFDRIRNREGLSYGVNSRFTASSVGDNATFVAGAISNPKNTPKVEASFLDELAQTLKDGFKPEEVAAAQKSYRDQRVVGRSQDAALLGLISVREEHDRTLQWDEQMDAKLAALTVDQINAAIRRHMSLDQLTIVKAGDFKAAGAYQN
jgi:zinc protease